MKKEGKEISWFRKVFYSFYSSRFYNFVFREQKGMGFSLVVKIVFLTYFVPSVVIYAKLSGFELGEVKSEKLIEFRDKLQLMPEIKIVNGELVNEKEVVLNLSGYSKKVFVTSREVTSPQTLNTLMVFGKDGLYFRQFEFLGFLFSLVDLDFASIKNLDADVSFVPYAGDVELVVDGELIEKVLNGYLQEIGQKLIFPILPIVVALMLLLKYVEVIIFGILTRSLAARRGIILSDLEVKKLTIIALVPALFLKMLNGMFLWSSKFLITTPGVIFILLMKIYYIYHIVRSLKK
jgi:hypothetical protein